MGVTKKAIYPKSASQICYNIRRVILYLLARLLGKERVSFKIQQKYDIKSCLSNNDI